MNGRAAASSLLSVLACAASACGHGVPVDVLVNSTTNRLCVNEVFSVAEFTLFAGVEVSTDLPGITVFAPSNGVPAGTELLLDVTQPLMYWDGDSVETPQAAIDIINPDFDALLTVSATSGEQTGLSWGTYTGALFWERDGLFVFDTLTPQEGLYGIAARITAPGFGDSKPFLIPMAYDPTNALSGAEREEGFAALRALVDVPGSADFDGDGDTDLGDGLALQRGFGLFTQSVSHADGNADGDCDVDAADHAFWLDEFGSGGVPGAATAVVPEPAGTAVLAWLLVCFARRVEW